MQTTDRISTLDVAPADRKPGPSIVEKNATGSRLTTCRDDRNLLITDFQIIPPRFRSSQQALQEWLIAAHSRSARGESAGAWFSQYRVPPEQIAFRGHELEDFTHQRWDEMRLFGARASDIAEKTKFFSESVGSVFERFYPPSEAAPEAIVHVTCTGYSAPSGAQRLVSSRGWGRRTQVLHAYHMGCYAAHPALRIASGLESTDIVHTELCSLHLNPANHDPAQLVIQSLFADGFIKYRVTRANAPGGRGPAGLQILHVRDEIVSDSLQAMGWAVGPLIFDMTLSREVPVIFAAALPRFARSLFEEAGLDFDSEKEAAIFAIHPGGPRIIDSCARILQLKLAQVSWSWDVLREHGNMSSATLPHIWQRMLNDNAIPDGALVVSLGAGPGLTLSGALFRKRIAL